jgi:hypothetical protein
MNRNPLQPNWKRYRPDDDLNAPRAPSAGRAWSRWAAVSVVAIALAAGDWWTPRLLEWLAR